MLLINFPTLSKNLTHVSRPYLKTYTTWINGPLHLVFPKSSGNRAHLVKLCKLLHRPVFRNFLYWPMAWFLITLLLFAGFGILIVTFATASRLAGYVRPYVGLALIVAPIITALLDFTVWAVAESVVTVLFFSFYPNDQISRHGVIAPVSVLIGCFASVTIAISLVFFGLGGALLLAITTEVSLSTLVSKNSAIYPYLPMIAIAVLAAGLVAALAAMGGMLLLCYKHLWPRFLLALRVLGQNV